MTLQPKKPNKKGKKVLSLILSILLVVGAVFPFLLKGGKKLLGLVNSKFTYEEFDIDQPDEVSLAAENIEKDSEKQYTKEQIRDLLYFLNGKTEKIDFTGMTGQEAFKYLQDLMGIPLALLDDNTTDDHEKVYGNLELVEEDEEIFSADLTATDNNHDRKEAIEFSDITNEQLVDIDEENTKDYAENTENFYNKFIEVKNNDKITDGIKIAILLDAKSKMHLYPSLTEEQKVEIDETLMLLQNKYGMAEFTKVAAQYDWDVDAIANSGDYAKPVTPEGKTYNDADKAEQYRPKVDESSVVVEQGGQKVETITEVIKDSKPIKDEIVTEVQKVPTTEPHTEIIDQGGKVESTEIYTEVYEVEPDEVIVTEIIEEGGVEQGTEFEDYTFVDDALVTTSVLTK